MNILTIMRNTQFNMRIYHPSFPYLLRSKIHKARHQHSQLPCAFPSLPPIPQEGLAISFISQPPFHPLLTIRILILPKTPPRSCVERVWVVDSSVTFNSRPPLKIRKVTKREFNSTNLQTKKTIQDQTSIFCQIARKKCRINGQWQIQHYMGSKEEWLINFQGKSIHFQEINRNTISSAEEAGSISFGEIELNEEMKENKVKEAQYITNYFIIADITAYIQTLTSMAKITQIDLRKLANKLEMHKFKAPSPEEENANTLQTSRAKVEACFSRRWREVQVTVYLLLHNFVTPEKTTKTRVLILNQRGLILQIISNVNPQKCSITVAKNIKSSYSRLKNLVILSHSEQYVDLDCMNTFQEVLTSVNVLLVSYSSLEKLQSLPPYHLSSCQFSAIDLNGGMRLSEYNRQRLMVWHRKPFKQQYLNYFISNLLVILARERKVQLFFKEYPYNHHQFNQKQFLLRLFSFYFNSITLQRMDGWDNSQIKDTLLNTCTDQLTEKQKQLLAKNGDREVHTFTTNSTSLLCPVCKKKSKIICLKCSGEFGTKFGLCEISCFERFHENRIRYAHEISSRRKICDFSIQNRNEKRPNEEESDDEAQSDDNVKPPPIIQAKSYQQVLEKWGKPRAKEQQELDEFMKLSSMNFIPKGFADRVKLLQNKIGQLSLIIEEKRIRVKQEE